MLPEVKLDNSSFEEIAREARSRIAGIYPEWTDYNYHDPGITFLEMFSYLKEVQQFHMDQIGQHHKRKFLKLLGMTPKKRRPAVLKAKVQKEGSVILPEGSRFMAGNLVFETEREEYLPESRIQAAVVKDYQGHVLHREKSIRRDSKIMVYPFGRKPEAGNQFLMCLDLPIEPGKECCLSFQMYDEYRIKRNPVKQEKDFSPLAEIAVEYKTREGWKRAKVICDSSLALIQSGGIRFSLEREMEKIREEGIEGYFLRLLLKKQEYDTVPLITGLSFRHICLLQKETKACWKQGERKDSVRSKTEQYIEENGRYRLLKNGQKAESNETVWTSYYLPEFFDKRCVGVGNGFPGQRFQIPGEGFMSEGLIILVESLTEPGVYEMWEQVEDFDAVGPEVCCYQVDEKAGEIIFGDSFHGMAPETEIRIVSCFCTAGSAGNMKAGKEVEKDHIICRILEEGEGGTDGETMEECALRAAARMRQSERAVSESDYEKLVKKTPGLRVQAVKVLSPSEEKYLEDNVVDLAVRPYCENGEGILSSVYKKNILAYLEDKRLLGTRICLHSPEYTEIGVYVEASVKPEYLHAREQIQRKITEFFKEMEGKFGPFISRGSLYGSLDSLDCIMKIHMLSIEARGNRISRSRTGDVFLPPTGMAVLKDVKCIVVNN